MVMYNQLILIFAYSRNRVFLSSGYFVVLAVQSNGQNNPISTVLGLEVISACSDVRSWNEVNCIDTRVRIQSTAIYDQTSNRMSST